MNILRGSSILRCATICTVIAFALFVSAATYGSPIYFTPGSNAGIIAAGLSGPVPPDLPGTGSFSGPVPPDLPGTGSFSGPVPPDLPGTGTFSGPVPPDLPGTGTFSG